MTWQPIYCTLCFYLRIFLPFFSVPLRNHFHIHNSILMFHVSSLVYLIVYVLFLKSGLRTIFVSILTFVICPKTIVMNFHKSFNIIFWVPKYLWCSKLYTRRKVILFKAIKKLLLCGRVLFFKLAKEMFISFPNCQIVILFYFQKSPKLGSQKYRKKLIFFYIYIVFIPKFG